MILINVINELFRALPILSSSIFFIIFLIKKDIYMLYIFIGTLLLGCVTHISKNIIFKYIETLILNYRFNFIKSILGPFERPLNAKNCGNFYISEKNFSYTPGMPSGHSILAGYISIYMYYYLINKYKIHKSKYNITLSFCILFTFYTMYTRVLFNCHTIQQTIIGAMIGIIIGHYYYLLSKKLIND